MEGRCPQLAIPVAPLDNMRVLKGWTITMAAASLLAASAGGEEPSRRSFGQQFEQAVQLLGEFKDEDAAAALRALLRQHPPDEIGAKAHLYLAIIWMNVDDARDAKHEMQLALALNGLIELPKGVSPKARILFTQAQRAAEQGQGLPQPAERPKPAAVSQPAPAALASAPTAAPIAAPPTAPPEAPVETWTEREKPSGSSHALGITLGSVGIVAGVVAIVAAVEVSQFQSTSSQVEANLLSGAPDGQSFQALSSQQQAAVTWRAVGFTCAGVAVAALTAAVFTW